MTPAESEADLKARCLRVLYAVAPDAEDEVLDPAVPLRQQIDFDSMDQLNVALGLNREFGLEIPEKDYPQLASIDGIVAYVRTRTG